MTIVSICAVYWYYGYRVKETGYLFYTPRTNFEPGDVFMPRRADRVGQHKTAYQKNRGRILATQDTCGICGKPVDKSLKWPDPMCACIDHIVPIAKGGHPSDLSNLQLAHFACNRQKSDKLMKVGPSNKADPDIGNRDLPLSRNWKNYKLTN